MPSLPDTLKFHLERLLLRGAHYRLGLMALAILAVSLCGGAALVALGEGSLPESAWWAFLRLTDPGYLGDDEGVARRIVSTMITVAGYVLFMGALIAILTEWLHSTVRRLQRGETPITLRDHLLVLGMTERTPVVVEELLASHGRVHRFLALRGARKLTIVVLVDHLDEDVRAHLAEELGRFWDDRKIVLRSGTPLVAEHLDRVAFADAAAILIPGSGQGRSAADHDAITVKTVLAIANHPALRAAPMPPRLVAEVADTELARVVDTIYPGRLEVIPGDAVVSQLLAQNLRHRGLSWIIVELLALHRGRNLIFPSWDEMVGRPFGEIAGRVRGGVPMGFVRQIDGMWAPFLNPDRALALADGDRLVCVADRFEDLRLDAVGTPWVTDGRDAPPPAADPVDGHARRVLLLGWNRRIPALLHERGVAPRTPHEARGPTTAAR